MTDRYKPPMPPGLAARLPEAERRVEQRPLNPGVMIEAGTGPLSFASPHSDDAGWRQQIADAFGSNSYSIAQAFLRQLGDLCSNNVIGDRLVPDETELNALLGFINSIRPANELQAALAAQMVAVHIATMRLAAQALRGAGIDKLTANSMARLSSTFASQCEALDRLKGRRGRQEINVRYERHDHKHVHVDGGGSGRRNQAHAPRLPEPSGLEHNSNGDHSPLGENECSAEMLGSDPLGGSLPSAGGKRT